MRVNQLGSTARSTMMQTPRIAVSLAMTALLLDEGLSKAEGEGEQP